jgi:hypothetical protein
MAKITKWLNPWLVESIEAFNFYCCPECNFRSNEANFFQVHALQNHDLSQALFNNLDLDIKVDIKLEQSETEPEIQLGIDEQNGAEEHQRKPRTCFLLRTYGSLPKIQQKFKLSTTHCLQLK